MLNYQETINYIHSFSKFHRTNSLENIKNALNQLGNPQNSYQTIHVTGTNGKGSTCNYLANLLEATGKRVGMFTSPFITKFNERIQINHEMISDDELVSLVSEVREITDKIDLTEFEFVVILGFMYFQKKVDVAIIEVGIGAAHDKTNVIVPEVSIITSIDLDHEKIIGPTIQDIAIEKSGIIKNHKPIVTGYLQNDIRNIVLNKSKDLDSQLFEFGHDFKVENFLSGHTSEFDYVDNNIKIEKIKCAGFEKTTAMNMSIAIKAFLVYQAINHEKIDLELIKEGIESHLIPGRMQIVQKEPTIILDGSHNFAAIYNLINSLISNWQNKDIIVVYAGMKDKDRKDILNYLAKHVSKVYVTTLDMQRSADEADYDISVYNNVDFVKDYRSKIKSLQDNLTDQQVLLVTGSFYLISDLEKKFS
ncbi:bifunctional folylpolyglutamate synthase/dihydrofolate synthase [Companilactobacillus baiquanensis]|uniref:tetrahydrofolate synthase n=1 Tax=Companilactobacillus baiquanensis TaxID=2486005 RepID=A0ABW1UXK3_9LACO|nr:folylpolyglutamate synthase/dihydrofolate synthase family protein [Companilactobacillus baiquanensis]